MVCWPFLVTLRNTLIAVLYWLVILLTQTLASGSLDIYFIDVEGGAATLIITPLGESVLVDTGWRREDGRDPRRIHRVAQGAGLKKIDYLITTHFHRDHYGGIRQLADLIPITSFLDHGPINNLDEDPRFSLYYGEYLRATRGERQKIHPGETIPLKSLSIPLQLLCLAAGGKILKGQDSPNPACEKLTRKGTDTTENARSVALLLRFGQFEFLNLGDLTWNVESRLVCPTNLLGKIDLYQVTHHGLDSSNNPVLLSSISPTVAVYNNGPRKGAHPKVFNLLKSLSSIEQIFQIHKNLDSAPDENTPEDFIANLGTESICAGQFLKVSVKADSSSFTVTNSRNNTSQTFPSR